jgi:hypothetical protein
VGEKVYKDGKKKRIPVRDGQRPYADIGGIRVPVPPLEQLSVPRFRVMEHGVQFWADWNGKQICWTCGRRQLKQEMFRWAAAAFSDTHWMTFLTPDSPKPKKTGGTSRAR